ncbi:MAG: endonuclease/exonuclease/phosphatase family protein [Cellulosilyticaceae bacterium]
MKKIKIMTFNMKRNYIPNCFRNFNKRRTIIEEIIKKYEPDIIGTQELTNKMIHDLKNIFKGKYECIGMGRDGGEKGEHAAIFYKKETFEVDTHYTFWLSRTPDVPSRGWLAFFPRICTSCELKLKDNKDQHIKIYNTHLDHISYLARIKGLELIMKKMENDQKNENMPMILMGDFNAKPNSKTMKWWQKYLINQERFKIYDAFMHMENVILRRSYHGYNGKKEGSPIDYIFASEQFQMQKIEICRDQVNGLYPSDHYPILATFQI